MREEKEYKIVSLGSKNPRDIETIWNRPDANIILVFFLFYYFFSLTYSKSYNLTVSSCCLFCTWNIKHPFSRHAEKLQGLLSTLIAKLCIAKTELSRPEFSIEIGYMTGRTNSRIHSREIMQGLKKNSL